MKTSEELKLAFNFTRYNIIPIYGWSPGQNISTIQRIIFELYWWLIFLSSIILLFPLLASAYKYRDNSEIMTKSICLSCAVSQCSIKIIFCRLRGNELKNLFKEIEDFIKYSSDSDQLILMKYVTKCSGLHIIVTIWTYLTSFSFIISPFLSEREFPTDAVYPFSIENTYIKSFIYLNQCLVAIQTAAAVLLDCLMAMLLWFICARFEILALSISKCNNIKSLKNYIQQHQNLIRYTDNFSKTISVFVLSTLSTSVGGVLFSAIQLVSNEPLAIKVQYAIVGVTASVGLFICAWAADSLLQMGYLVGIKAFQSKWYIMEYKSQSCILNLIAQSQNPIKIKANSMLPSLSLSLFSQFLLNSFKFFTTLRIIVGKNYNC